MVSCLIWFLLYCNSLMVACASVSCCLKEVSRSAILSCKCSTFWHFSDSLLSSSLDRSFSSSIYESKDFNSASCLSVMVLISCVSPLFYVRQSTAYSFSLLDFSSKVFSRYSIFYLIRAFSFSNSEADCFWLLAMSLDFSSYWSFFYRKSSRISCICFLSFATISPCSASSRCFNSLRLLS